MVLLARQILMQLAARDIRQLTDMERRSTGAVTARSTRIGGWHSARAERGVGGNVDSPVIHDRTGPAAGSVAEDVTEPLAAVGQASRMLPVQIARFGNLAGRDLSARAFAARRERDGSGPGDRGDAAGCRPLSQAEQLEMRALRTVLTSGYQPAVPAGPGGAGRLQGLGGLGGLQGPGTPQSLLRLARLRRPSPLPGPRRDAARHRRPAVTDPG